MINNKLWENHVGKIIPFVSVPTAHDRSPDKMPRIALIVQEQGGVGSVSKTNPAGGCLDLGKHHGVGAASESKADGI